jgi:RNA polymerase sigma factor (sigma-70 family)
MAGPRNDVILNYLRHVLGTPANGGVSDAELLRRFIQGRDEAAFELLLWRHAGLVLHVCRQVLRDADEDEDSFQATFLVLIRKSGSISRKESLGGWLHRVAFHTALKLRQKLARRTTMERALDDFDAPALEKDDAERRELRRMVCEEVNRLPPKYRAPIVACYFEAKTHEEAAHQLGWPQGTVASLLARGRDLLHRRLIRRGLTLSATVFAAVLSTRTSQAALAARITTTMKMLVAGSMAGAIVSPRIAALARGVSRAMFWTRTKIVAAVVLLAVLSGVAPTLWHTPRITAEQPGDKAAKTGEARGREGAGGQSAEDPAQVARNMAISRLNMRKLVSSMHKYAEANQGRLPPPAVPGKDGKMLLSWRVLLLPYLGEGELYEKFKLSEPWDSPHNKKLLPRMPEVYAAPGVKLRQPFYTFYQVFVSPKPKEGEDVIQAAFVEGWQMRFPASFTDGTANTILIIEGGEAAPWTKPVDLPYVGNQALPKLGGAFTEVIQAATASGDIFVISRKYDESNLRAAITSNGGEVINTSKLEAQPLPSVVAAERADRAIVEWRRKNEYLRRELKETRERMDLLQDELDVLRERSGDKKMSAAELRLERLKQENARLEAEQKKLYEEIADLVKEIQKLQQHTKKKAP